MEDKILVSPDEGARRIGVGLTMMYELLARNEIASIKVGRRRLIPVRALEDFAERKLAETVTA